MAMYAESVLLGLDEGSLQGEGASGIMGRLLPFPEPDANKYTRGKLTLVAGCARYPGAAVLAARASQRMGAGYTEVICAPESVATVRAASPSLVVAPWDGWRAESLPAYTEGKPAAVCVGPGFDASDPAAVDLAAQVLAAAECPVVVDGGGLAVLAQPRAMRIMERRAQQGLPTVATPHGGEARRIAAAWGIGPDAGDAADFALDLAGALGCTVLLKGPDTQIAYGDAALEMDFGGPELAKAGTGDVLAGIVGALLAQGLNDFDAAVLGATVHALAGAYAAERLTSICVTAEDVIETIPLAIAGLAGEPC